MYVLIAGAGLVLVMEKCEKEREYSVIESPCSEPVSFFIADIDSRFDLDERQLRRLIIGAGDLWSNAAGRSLVEFDSDGDVGIHLIYDDRQQLVDEERQYTGEIHMEQMRFDRIYRNYERLSDEYDQALSLFNQIRDRFDEEVREHNEQVTAWNKEGGAPESEKESIQNRERELEEMRTEVLVRQRKMNETGEALERVTEQLNEISNRKDGLIQSYNEQFAGEYRFNQGEYIRNQNERKINIYHFKSLNHLRLVLAHEIGHALGLGHVDSPESVMYPVVKSFTESSVTLSSDDIAAIQDRCRS